MAMSVGPTARAYHGRPPYKYGAPESLTSSLRACVYDQEIINELYTVNNSKSRPVSTQLQSKSAYALVYNLTVSIEITERNKALCAGFARVETV